MPPQDAAKACEWLGVKQVVPMHFGTFPVLTGVSVTLAEAEYALMVLGQLLLGKVPVS